jgi:hypothetical protein
VTLGPIVGGLRVVRSGPEGRGAGRRQRSASGIRPGAQVQPVREGQS